MDEQTQLLREIRDLLLLMAEPAIAKRDEALRNALIEIVGKSPKRAKAVQLMDGSRNQTQICKDSKIDPGELSRLMKTFREKSLLKESDSKQPELALSLPSNFFSTGAK